MIYIKYLGQHLAISKQLVCDSHCCRHHHHHYLVFRNRTKVRGRLHILLWQEKLRGHVKPPQREPWAVPGGREVDLPGL